MAMWRIHIAFWIPKATNTRSGCIILIVFHNNGCTRASQCYFLRTILLFLYLIPVNAFTVASPLCMFVPYDIFLQVFRPNFFYQHLFLHVAIRGPFNFMGSEEIGDKGFCWGNPKESVHSLDLGVEESLGTKCNLN